MKSLVAYFSCSGTTEKVAKLIADTLHADLYEIKPKEPYTSADLNWMDSSSRSSVEMRDKSSRPAIGNKVENMEAYDVVYLGFPIWWYIVPTIINTFLESYDFKGKTIVPFATSGGSGAGKTDMYLHASCSEEVNWKPTTMLNGNVTKEQIKKWLDNMHIS